MTETSYITGGSGGRHWRGGKSGVISIEQEHRVEPLQGDTDGDRDEVDAVGQGQGSLVTELSGSFISN